MSLLCGIGFTMCLFIASLAFAATPNAYGGLERLGILIGSLLSGVLGYGVLRFWTAGGVATPTRRAESH